MKKAQLMGQPFVYIFAIVVIALVLIFGIKTIKDINNFGNQVENTVFINNLKTRAGECYNLDSGSTCSLKELKLSSQIKWVCFVGGDRATILAQLSNVKDTELRDIIKLNVDNNIKDNIYFGAFQGYEMQQISTRIDKIQVEGIICKLNQNGFLDASLENKGSYLEVK